MRICFVFLFNAAVLKSMTNGVLKEVTSYVTLSALMKGANRSMNIAVIDADLLGRTRHRFPNLACMKISGYHKEQGHSVALKLDYDGLKEYDKVYISKVFTDTVVPNEVLTMQNVEYGGTGFFFDQAPPLPYAIEHHMPDYHLYDDYISMKIASGAPRSEYKSYLNYSIGFLTRGCFRKCGFGVNKNYDRVFAHSPLAEFYDP